MTAAYTLDEVHEEIHSLYLWWSITAGPEVAVQEAGHLADLWAVHDRLVEEAKKTMTDDEIAYEFGVNNG